MRVILAIFSVVIILTTLIAYFSEYSVMVTRKVNSVLPISYRFEKLPSVLTVTALPIDASAITSPPLHTDVQSGHVITVNDIPTLELALVNAKPGQVIYLDSGIYQLNKTVSTKANGAERNPITLTASPSSRVIVNTDVGLKIKHSHWHVEGLNFTGKCKSHSLCEHAIQIVGGVNHTTIFGNTFTDFNAHIKSNGIKASGNTTRVFPTEVRIANNQFTNSSIRNTANPVTPIDVVGGDSIHLLNNFIADFAKNGGNRTTYGAFLKGGGSYGLIKGNTVACVHKLPIKHIDDIRIGLSLGGGTTGVDVCQSSNCGYEHKHGVVENNTIINCAYDPAIFINKVSYSEVNNNKLMNSRIIQVKKSSNITLNSNEILL